MTSRARAAGTACVRAEVWSRAKHSALTWAVCLRPGRPGLSQSLHQPHERVWLVSCRLCRRWRSTMDAGGRERGYGGGQRRERGGGVPSRGTERRRRLWTALRGSGVDGISITVHPLGSVGRSIRHVRPRFDKVAV